MRFRQRRQAALQFQKTRFHCLRARIQDRIFLLPPRLRQDSLQAVHPQKSYPCTSRFSHFRNTFASVHSKHQYPRGRSEQEFVTTQVLCADSLPYSK